MKTSKTIFAIMAAAFLAAGVTSGHEHTAHQDPIPTITVCEALAHPMDYDGKMVHMRDDAYSNGEGAAFVGKGCPGIFVTEGKVWPSAVAWTMPTDLMAILHPV